MSNIVYISGQITGLSVEKYTERFNKTEKHLHCKIVGYEFCSIIGTYFNKTKVYTSVINPLSIRPLFGIKRWFFFMVADILVLITKADTIYMLNNWKFSKGAKIERFVGLLFNKKIEYEL